MFESSVVPNAPRARRGWTLSLSTSLQVAAVAAAVVFPLLKVEALPPVKLIPRPPVPRFRPIEIVATSRAAASAATSAPRLAQPRPFVAPTRVPNHPPVIFAEGMDTMPVASDHNAGPRAPYGSPLGFDPVGMPPAIAPPSRPAPALTKPPEPAPTKPVRVGGSIRQPRLIREVKPTYPQLARQARVQGVVRLNAIVNRSGQIQALNVTSGHPLLVQAALDAVRQWLYEPTLLNGQPVDIILAVDVNFTLSQ